MGDAETIGDLGSIVYVPPGATSAGTSCGGAVVVELQRGADDLEALLDEPCRGYGRIDPTRHRHDDAMTGRITRKVEVRCAHNAPSKPICQKSASEGEYGATVGETGLGQPGLSTVLRARYG